MDVRFTSVFSNLSHWQCNLCGILTSVSCGVRDRNPPPIRLLSYKQFLANAQFRSCAAGMKPRYKMSFEFAMKQCSAVSCRSQWNWSLKQELSFIYKISAAKHL